MTPEGRVKAKIKDWLDKWAGVSSYCTPVPSAFGRNKGEPDYTICFDGLYVVIEAKALGEGPTEKQKLRHAELRRSGALVFVVDNPDQQLPQIERQVVQRARAYRRALEEL